MTREESLKRLQECIDNVKFMTDEDLKAFKLVYDKEDNGTMIKDSHWEFINPNDLINGKEM